MLIPGISSSCAVDGKEITRGANSEPERNTPRYKKRSHTISTHSNKTKADTNDKQNKAKDADFR